MLFLPELGHQPLHTTKHSLTKARTRLLLPHTEEPVREHCHSNLENDVDPHEAKVAPALRVVDVGACEELVGDAERAVFAGSRRSRVPDRTARHRCIWAKVLLASLAGGRWEDAEFCLGACDLAARQHGRGDTSHPVGERRHAVHEDL